jgi:DHA2 family multidrug resistance protein
MREGTKAPIDFVGLVLIGTGLGARQVVQDKGQRDDWFNSPFITWFATTSAAALIALVFWEWKQKHSIIHLRLFRNSSFAVANVIMLASFASLLATTVLVPQFAQTEMGYTAEKAGELLSP